MRRDENAWCHFWGYEESNFWFLHANEEGIPWKGTAKVILDEAIWFRDASGVISPLDNFPPFSHAKTLLWNLYKRKHYEEKEEKKYENCIQMVDETK